MKVTCTNKPDFNLIAQALSYLLSEQLDAEIVVKMTPKDKDAEDKASSSA